MSAYREVDSDNYSVGESTGPLIEILEDFCLECPGLIPAVTKCKKCTTPLCLSHLEDHSHKWWECFCCYYGSKKKNKPYL